MTDFDELLANLERPQDERAEELPIILGGTGLTTAELIERDERSMVAYRAERIQHYGELFAPAFEAMAAKIAEQSS